MAEKEHTIYDAMKEARRERHANWNRINMKVMEASGIPFIRREHALLIREPGKPKVDFFPGTGRWRSYNATFNGGAKKFLSWYEKQREEGETP